MTAVSVLRGGALIGLLAIVAPVSVQGQSGDESRISPSGPYRSKMRIVEDIAPIAPQDAQTTLDALRDDAYGSALFLRNLGYAAAADGDAATAITRLRDALDRDALAPLAQAQIRADLIRLWASSGDDAALADAYTQWEAAGHDFEAGAHVAAARALTRTGRYEGAADALDRALAGDPSAPASWRELQVYVLSALARYPEAAAVKARLLRRDTASRDDWLQLAGLYQSAGNQSATLAAMELGYRSAKLTRPSDITTLAILYRRSGLPDFAARLLADNLSRGVLSDNGTNWLSLAEAHLEARSDEAALEPLSRAAALHDDPMVDLQLGRLRFRLGQYPGAIASLTAALRRDLGPEEGRALLLLGEAYVETGSLRRARRAFAGAAELGGSYLEAQSWLDRLAQDQAAVALPGGAEDLLPEAPGLLPEPVGDVVADLPVKTVHRQRFYYTSDEANFADLPVKSVEMARRLRNSVRRERLTASGPLQFIVLAEPGTEQDGFELQVGIPVRTRVAPRGIFRNRDIKPFLCTYREFRGDAAALGAAWTEFALAIQKAGLEPTGETRTVVLNYAPPGEPLLFELQVGIRDDAG